MPKKFYIIFSVPPDICMQKIPNFLRNIFMAFPGQKNYLTVLFIKWLYLNNLINNFIKFINLNKNTIERTLMSFLYNQNYLLKGHGYLMGTAFNFSNLVTFISCFKLFCVILAFYP